MNFHQLVPEEVTFYRLFPYIDFHELIRIIPHVCSVWRRLIIEKLKTLHFYPNVDLINDQDETIIMKNSNIQLNMLPFIRYSVKFIQSNQMKIKHLFINGLISDIVFRKQFRPFDNLSNASIHDEKRIANRTQRESIEFYKKLSDSGDYFPNSLSEPALRRLTSHHNSYYGSNYDHYNGYLCYFMDSGTFQLLSKVCKDLQLVSLSNCVANNFLAELLFKSKIAVIDNSVLRNTENCSSHFEYLFFSERMFFYGPCTADYTESKKTIAVQSFKYSYSSKEDEFIDTKSQNVDYNLVLDDIFSPLTEERVRKMLEIICRMETPQLKRLTLGLGFLKTFNGNISFEYKGIEGKIEDLYIRVIGDAFSTVRLDRFVSTFRNMKYLVLEDVKSKDCALLKESISGMVNLTTFKVSFYEHCDEEWKYFDLISTLLEYKKLMKLSFGFPLLETIENESILISTLNDPFRKCWVSLKRLPQLTKETKLQLDSIQKLEYFTKIIIENDPQLPLIEYDQDLDTIIQQRMNFKLALQQSEIVCPGCAKLVPRHSIQTHFATHHNISDLVFDRKESITRKLAVCPCCKEEFPSHNVENHVMNCPERDFKFKMQDTSGVSLYNVGYYP